MNLFRDIGNILIFLLPTSSLYTLKRRILKLMGVKIGEGARVNGHTWFYGRGSVVIGKDTWIGPGCKFYSVQGVSIEIGDNCDIAPEVVFVAGSHEIGLHNRRAGKGYANNITIESGCWVGCRSTILGGVRIQAGSIIGAGAVVNTNVPSDTVAAGIPVRCIRKL